MYICIYVSSYCADCQRLLHYFITCHSSLLKRDVYVSKEQEKKKLPANILRFIHWGSMEPYYATFLFYEVHASDRIHGLLEA